MATSIGSIYVQVKSDSSEFNKGMSQLRQTATKSGKNVSEALNSAISPRQASAGIRTITTDLTKLAQTAKVPEKQFRQTADAISDGFKDVAWSVGMTDKEFARLNEKMLRNKAMRQTENSLRNITRAAGLSAKETRNMAIQMGHSSKAARRMSDKIHRLNKRTSALSGTMKTLGGIMGAYIGIQGVGALGDLVTASIDAADAIAKTADSIGISTDALQEYQYVADRSGVSTQQLNTGLTTFSKRLGEMRNDTGALKAMLGKYNEELMNQLKNTDDVGDAMDTYIDHLGGVENQTVRNALASAAFGRAGGVAMTNMIDNIDDLRERYHRLGINIEEDLLRNSEEAKDSIDDLSRVISTSVTSAVVTLAPEIGQAADNMARWVGDNKEFLTQDLPDHIREIAKAASFLASVLGGVVRNIAVNAQALALMTEGEISVIDFLTSSTNELAEMVEKFDERLNPTLHTIDQATEGFDLYAAGADKAGISTKDLSSSINELTNTELEMKYMEDWVDLVEKGNTTQEATLQIEEAKLRVRLANEGLNPTEIDHYIELLGITEDLAQAEKKLRKSVRDQERVEKERQKSIDSTIGALKEKEKTYGKTGRELLKYNLIQKKAASEEIKEALALYDSIDALKKKDKALRDAKKTQEEYTEETKDAHKDMSDTIQDHTSDIIADWDNAGDMLVNIAKRTAADMAAAFLTQQFIMPIATQIGGQMGMSWGGVPMAMMGSQAGVTGQSGMGFPSGSALQWAGKNIPGMGALGSAMAWTLPGTGGLTVNTMGAAAQLGVPQAGSISTIGGTSLGGALGYGAAGSLGYSLLGGSLGLPQSKYSGLGAGVGGALGGAYGGAAGAAMGLKLGSWAGPIGMGIGALLGGLGGSLFGGSNKEPKVAIMSGRWEEGHNWPGEHTSDVIDYTTWIQDVSADRKPIGDAMLEVFDAQFQAIEDAADWSLREALHGVYFRQQEKFKNYDGDFEQLLIGMSDKLFGQLRKPLLEGMGLPGDMFGGQFFEKIQTDDETLLNTFARFAIIADSIDDFAGRITEQTAGGKSAEQAFQDLVAIHDVLLEVDVGVESLTKSATINTIKALTSAQETYNKALREAGATTQEMADLQEGISIQIGHAITGLNANALQSAIVGGGNVTANIQDAIRQSMAQTIAGISAESIMRDFGNPLNEMIGQMFADFDWETGDVDEFERKISSILSDIDWTELDTQSQKAASMIDRVTGAIAGTSSVAEGMDKLLVAAGRLTKEEIFSRDFESKYGIAPSIEHSTRVLEFLSVATDETIQAVAQGFGVTVPEMFEDLVDEITTSTQKLQNNLNKAKTNYIGLLRQEIHEQETIVSTLSQSIDRLKDFRKSLFVSHLPLDESRDYALRAVESLSAEALAGDYSALEQIPDALSTLIETSKASSSTYVDYMRDTAYAIGKSEQLEEMAEEQVSEAKTQIRLFQKNLDTVEGIDKTTSNLAQAEAEYQSAKIALDAQRFDAEINTLLNIEGGIVDLIELYRESGVEKSTVDQVSTIAQDALRLQATQGSQSAFDQLERLSGRSYVDVKTEQWRRLIKEGDPNALTQVKDYNLNPQRISVADLELVLRGHGWTPFEHFQRYGQYENLPGFADGGILTGPASGYNVNTTFHGPEAIVPLDRIDHSALISEIRNLREEVSELRTESKAHQISLIKSSQKVERNTEKLDEWNDTGIPEVRVA